MIFRENTHQNCSFDLHSGGKMASMVDAHLNCICASTFNLIKFAPSADALSKIILKTKNRFSIQFFPVCVNWFYWWFNYAFFTSQSSGFRSQWNTTALGINNRLQTKDIFYVGLNNKKGSGNDKWLVQKPLKLHVVFHNWHSGSNIVLRTGAYGSGW